MRTHLSASTFVLRCVLVLAALAACPGYVAGAMAYSLLRLGDFNGGADGATPLAGVIMDHAGSLYGTTSAGAKDYGTIFKIPPRQALDTLYTFCSKSSCSDGASPHAGLIMDQSGSLYGTTNSGGAHDGGTVFEFTSGGVERVLYSFCTTIVGGYCGDGAFPVAGVIRDKAGNLYGTTTLGGTNDVGVVFELSFDARTGNWTENVLYSFCPMGTASGCPDGKTPLAGVVMDAAGNLYGTTEFGGAHEQGTVFKVRPSLKSESVVYSFCSQKNCGDGSEPNAGLIIDQTGHLYGTTEYGGNLLHCGNGGGVAFEAGPSAGTEKVLHAFCSRTTPPSDGDGSYPKASLFKDAAGDLYGTTTTGGASGQGVVFRLIGRTESVLYSFCSYSGCPEFPVAGVIMDTAGNFYGTTSEEAGSSKPDGAVFELKK
jgi:uncharacterized repeat protein (TIGR03803 family)